MFVKVLFWLSVPRKQDEVSHVGVPEKLSSKFVGGRRVFRSNRRDVLTKRELEIA